MDAIPRDYEARCMFDAFCKTVLRNEAKSYLAEMKRRRDREVSLSSLSQADLDKLCTVDHYPSDSFTFSSHGYDLHINNELVAEAFAALPSMEQSILICTVFWIWQMVRSAALWECPGVPFSGTGQIPYRSCGNS